MERRQFLKSIGGVAAACGAPSRSILDFAPCNGADDDGPGLREALVWSEANGQVVNLLNRKVLLLTPPGVVSTSRDHDATSPWGLVGSGAVIISRYDDQTKGVIDLRTSHDARNLWITGINFAGRGTRPDGQAYNGPALFLKARDDERGKFCNEIISHLRIEGHDYGIRFSGHVSEVTIGHIQVMDCVSGGILFEKGPESGGGGSIFLSEFIVSECGGVGVMSDNVRTLSISNGYIRNCAREGMVFTDGCHHPVINVEFENNWQSAPYADEQAHVLARNSAGFYGCFAIGNHRRNGARFLLRKAPPEADWTVLDCSVIGMAGDIPIGLLRTEGSGTVTKLNCSGADQVIAPAVIRRL